jgi:hypothetical protein
MKRRALAIAILGILSLQTSAQTVAEAELVRATYPGADQGPSLILVKHRVHRHKAHKHSKHKAPKHPKRA